MILVLFLRLSGGEWISTAGDVFATNQSGLPKWKFFLPYDDIDFLDDVKNDCKLLLNDATANRRKIDFLINTIYSEKEFFNYFSA